MNEPAPTDEQLARYLAGEMPESERAQIASWMAADVSHAREVDRLRALWTSRPPSASSSGASSAASRWNIDQAWSRVDAQLEDGTPVVPLPVRRPWHRAPVWRAAAAIVLVAGLGYWFRPQDGDVVPPEQQFATAIGAVQEVTLSDSTRVTLGPASTLVVSRGYGTTERTVVLRGEATFNVTHDEARPFAVRAASTVTQDIGTVFSVRALSGDSVVRVIVHEGVASLRSENVSSDRAVVLQAHEVGTLHLGTVTVRVSGDSGLTPVAALASLRFDNATVGEVTTELQRWYPIVVVTDDRAVLSRRLSATLPTNDRAEALDVLRLVLGIAVEQQGDTVRLR